MLNKLICLLSILCIFVLSATADDINFSGGNDWSNIQTNDSAWEGQKIIKNQDYEKVINELEKRKNAGKMRAQKKAGNPIMKNVEEEKEDFLKDFIEQYPLLNLTVPLLVKDVEIPIGHYKVMGKKTDGKSYITLSQAYNVIATIPVNETNDDFGMDEINFAKIEVVNNNVLKLMYGSMAFNGYAYLYYKNP